MAVYLLLHVLSSHCFFVLLAIKTLLFDHFKFFDFYYKENYLILEEKYFITILLIRICSFLKNIISVKVERHYQNIKKKGMVTNYRQKYYTEI